MNLSGESCPMNRRKRQPPLPPNRLVGGDKPIFRDHRRRLLGWDLTMKKIVLISLLVLVGLLIAGVASANAALVGDCNARPRDHPSRIFDCDSMGGFYIDGIVWDYYADDEADGHGTVYVNNCDPDCASGTYTNVGGGSFVLTDPTRCVGGTLFVAITWEIPALPEVGDGHRPCKPVLPMLTKAQAKHYIHVALNRKFNAGAAAASGVSVRRCHRRSRTRVRCFAGWVTGDLDFYGPVTIWLSRRGFDVSWNYAYRITRLDEYCALVEHKPVRSCVKTFVVH
jgi:hypothetical protein